MTDQRPNPDELLARVQAEERRTARGQLKIFLGYAAGVGKTYAMLEAARVRRAAGVDVVVGGGGNPGRGLADITRPWGRARRIRPCPGWSSSRSGCWRDG
jgi:hypothetical protein